MPDTTASAETTPSSTGQRPGTETDTTAPTRCRLPTQSSSPPQVSFSWTIVRVSPSRVTVSAPSSLLTSTGRRHRRRPPRCCRRRRCCRPPCARSSRRTPSRSRDCGVSIRHCVMMGLHSRCIASVSNTIYRVARLSSGRCRSPGWPVRVMSLPAPRCSTRGTPWTPVDRSGAHPVPRDEALTTSHPSEPSFGTRRRRGPGPPVSRCRVARPGVPPPDVPGWRWT